MFHYSSRGSMLPPQAAKASTVHHPVSSAVQACRCSRIALGLRLVLLVRVHGGFPRSVLANQLGSPSGVALGHMCTQAWLACA